MQAMILLWLETSFVPISKFIFAFLIVPVRVWTSGCPLNQCYILLVSPLISELNKFFSMCPFYICMRITILPFKKNPLTFSNL